MVVDNSTPSFIKEFIGDTPENLNSFIPKGLDENITELVRKDILTRKMAMRTGVVITKHEFLNKYINILFRRVMLNDLDTNLSEWLNTAGNLSTYVTVVDNLYKTNINTRTSTGSEIPVVAVLPPLIDAGFEVNLSEQDKSGAALKEKLKQSLKITPEHNDAVVRNALTTGVEITRSNLIFNNNRMQWYDIFKEFNEYIDINLRKQYIEKLERQVGSIKVDGKSNEVPSSEDKSDNTIKPIVGDW